MDWVLTNAQYELLLCDAPVIIYNRDDDTPKEHSKKEMDDLVARWNEKKKKEKEQGIQVNLNDFLRRGIDAINEAKTK
ncbi:hypothetical protein [Bacteroides salyersiae]|uniref:hypothetical protein n=1 Tax=Bacteroides salyersiae TaxID=291644 RepID=UPI0034A48554